MNEERHGLIVAALAAVLVAGCYESSIAEGYGTSGSGEGQGAGGADQGDDDDDNDNNDDATVDTDVEPGTDTGAPGDCPESSGWPCTCSPADPSPPIDSKCEDGSDCIAIAGLGDGMHGYCAAQCSLYDDSCPESAWGTPSCAVTEETQTLFWCLLICDGPGDGCPGGQICRELGGQYFCHP